MRKLVLLLIILISFSFLSFKDNSALKYKRVNDKVMVREDGGKYMIGVINLKLKDNVSSLNKTSFGIISIDNVISQYSVSKVFQKFPLLQDVSKRKPMDDDIAKIYTIVYSGKIDPNELSDEIKRNCGSLIEYVEPEFVYDNDFIPNDPNVGSQYHIAKINCYQGWDINQGDTNVVIGIVDSGSDLDHPDLAANIKYNYADPINGIDDDANGFIDDFAGWDFYYYDNDPNIMGGSDHGSHVSGCASQVTNNAIHGSGPGFKCKLRISKHAPDYPDNGIYNFTQGIDYLYHNGVKVINCSFGSGTYSSVAQNLINAAWAAGVVICASAGNDGQDIFRYPACYEHVVSVAASTNTDTKASFSNFHDSVDVIAPGQGILSTVYNNSYAIYDGTSMSTPITCGTVAIIRSKYPAFSPEQTVNRLKLGVDSIYNINPSYVGKLGTGRINMFKCVSDLPIISIISFSAKDSLYGNNDGVFDINEKVTLQITYKNVWQAGNNISLRLTSSDPDIEITKDSVFAWNLSAYYTYSTAVTNTFEVRAKTTCPMDKVIQFKLRSSASAYTDDNSNTFSTTFRLGFAQHNVNNLKMALTRDGAVGKKTQPYGSGLQITGYPNNNIFEGGLMIGTSDTRVSDVCRRGIIPSNFSDTDFTALKTYNINTQGNYQYGSGYFNDNGAGANKIGVTVRPESFAYNNAPDQNYIILRYWVKNTSGGSISNMYTGIYMYFVPRGMNSNNYTNLDAPNNLGYSYNGDTSNPYLGVALLSNQTLNFKALAGGEVLNGFTTLEKWNALKNGTTDSLSQGPGINCMVVSAGPINLNNNDSVAVGFAIVKGNDLIELQNNTITAKTKYTVIGINQISTIVPDKFALYQNYPNPFNPSTTIKFDVAKPDFITISVYDILGRLVEEYSDQLEAGTYKYDFEGTNFATGVYFYKLESGYFSDIKKMILVK